MINQPWFMEFQEDRVILRTLTKRVSWVAESLRNIYFCKVLATSMAPKLVTILSKEFRNHSLECRLIVCRSQEFIERAVDMSFQTIDECITLQLGDRCYSETKFLQT